MLLDGGVGWRVGADGEHQLVPGIVRVDGAWEQEGAYPGAVPATGMAHRRPPGRDRDVQLGDPSARHTGSAELGDVADHRCDTGPPGRAPPPRPTAVRSAAGSAAIRATGPGRGWLRSTRVPRRS